MNSLIKIGLCLSILLFSCQNSPKQEEDKSELEQYIPSIFSISELYILTDKVCPTCNKELSKKLEQKVNDKSCFIVISAHPGKVNTKSFENATNVLFDYEKNYLNYGFPDSTGIFKIKDGKIVSRLYIDPSTIHTVLN